MPSLQYTEISDYERGVGEEQFAKLVFQGPADIEFDDESVPSDPFAEEGWDMAAYKLLEAEQEVEDMLSRQYEVPLESMPEHLKGWIIEIAVYKLYARTGRIPESITDRRGRAMDSLQMIAEGEVSLNLTDDEGATEHNDIGSGKRSDSIFSGL